MGGQSFQTPMSEVYHFYNILFSLLRLIYLVIKYMTMMEKFNDVMSVRELADTYGLQLHERRSLLLTLSLAV